jgi:hypothetical protein
MKIDLEQVLGIWANGKLYCTECAEKEKVQASAAEDYLTEEKCGKQNAAYFCDCCGELIYR